MANISKPYTFSANTVISPSEVNADLDTIYNEFNGNISAANLATAAVTTAKIADSAVTTDKVNDSAITTAKINDGAVTNAKLATGAGEPGGAWTTWTPTFVGFSSNPTNVFCRYKQVGKTVFVSIAMGGSGTSNSTSFTMTLPVSASTTPGAAWAGFAQVIDNFVVPASPGLLIAYAATPTVITCFPGITGGNWTASGGKRIVFGSLVYEAA